MNDEFFCLDDNQHQSIISNLYRLFNTRLGMSYHNYGLKSIEDYKRELIYKDTLIDDIRQCIKLYEKRLTDITITSIKCQQYDEFKRFKLDASYMTTHFSATIIVFGNGHIVLQDDGD